MDRRYYAVKASIFVLSLTLAVTCGLLEASRGAHHRMRDAHYQAAIVMDAAMRSAGQKLVSSVLHGICAVRASL